MEWTLDGVALGPFRGLSEDHIKSLRFEGDFHGCKVFSTTECPKGTLELWDRGQRVAVITGLGD